MKRILTILVVVLGFVVQGWGQEGKISEQNIEEVKIELDKIEKSIEKIRYLIKSSDEENNKKVETFPQFKVVTSVKVKKDTLYVSGFEKESGKFREVQQSIESNYVYTNKTIKWFPTASLMSVPFKMRPKTKDVPFSAYSDLKNVAINVDFFSKQWDRYFATGKTSTHRASAGLFASPLVEELTVENSKNQTAKNSQLFLSAGISINYSYNKLTFTFIPLGFDIATNNVGKEWIHNGNYWWGFGIGVDLKILEGVLKS